MLRGGIGLAEGALSDGRVPAVSAPAGAAAADELTQGQGHDSPARLECPPLVPFCLSVGVTGHRSEAGNGYDLSAAGPRVAQLLAELRAAAERLLEKEAAFFAPAPPCFRFVSPLAEGADQIAAQAALAAGFELQAVLPFERAAYEEDFRPDTLASFSALLSQAGGVLELPGDRAQPLEAFVMAGRATVAHCDLLIAVWDGQPARGRGGTAEVVEHALRRGTPLIHLPIDPAQPLRLVWSGFDPLVEHERVDDMPARPCDAARLDELFAALLGPPREPIERSFLSAYLGERELRRRHRIEYPLLLAATGVRPLTRDAWRAKAYGETTAGEWAPYRAACEEGRHGVRPWLGLLQDSYCWADRLALHFAQTYRSGHVFNFGMAGLVTVVALAVIVAPALKIVISVAELLLISTVIANTRYGTAREWHRRWLDYRQLAERLRPMRSLKLLGISRPRSSAEARSEGRRRWLDWYAASVWRATGCPRGRIAPERVAEIARFACAEELRPQIAWHRSSAHHTEHLDHRLHMVGTVLFFASIAGSALFLVGYYLWHDWTMSWTDWFVFASGALPALGTAIFGMRVQGEFRATAQRSRVTAARLEAIADALDEPDLTLTRAADLMEEAARTMLADLGEWRLAHQQRQLVIPG